LSITKNFVFSSFVVYALLLQGLNLYNLSKS